jgi:hypothetical protein
MIIYLIDKLNLKICSKLMISKYLHIKKMANRSNNQD